MRAILAKTGWLSLGCIWYVFDLILLRCKKWKLAKGKGSDNAMWPFKNEVNLCIISN